MANPIVSLEKQGQTASALDMDQFALAQSGDDDAEGLTSFLEKCPAKYTGA